MGHFRSCMSVGRSGNKMGKKKERENGLDWANQSAKKKRTKLAREAAGQHGREKPLKSNKCEKNASGSTWNWKWIKHSVFSAAPVRKQGARKIRWCQNGVGNSTCFPQLVRNMAFSPMNFCVFVSPCCMLEVRRRFITTYSEELERKSFFLLGKGEELGYCL